MLSKNKPCICGSGKQYKRCCINNPNIKVSKSSKVVKKSIKSISDFVKIVDYPIEVFNRRTNPKKEVLFVRNLSKLPVDLKQKINKLTSKFPPSDSECVRYSQFISSSIDEVKVEIGLYKLESLKDIFHGSIPKKDGWYDIEEGSFKTQCYIENGEVWGIHCWNSYNDIHFDCMKDLLLKKKLPNQWIEYKNIDSVDMNFEKESLKENVVFILKNDIIKNRFCVN